MSDIWTKGGNARREEVFLRAYAGEGIRRDDVEPGAQQAPPQLARCIDHTLLTPDATLVMIEQLCREAVHYRFAAVCVNPRHVSFCSQLMQDSGVGIGTVVGFPLGANDTEIKAFEARRCVQLGATEIDMVMAIGALKGEDHAAVYRDLAAVRRQTMGLALLKVIIECSLLDDPEKEVACRLCLDAGVDFVQTGTGFAGAGAAVQDVALMRRAVGGRIGVKASGGIRDLETARAMLAAGANRLGTGSGVAILAAADAEDRGE